MFVCVVVSLSQPSSRDLLYVKCLCVLSHYLSPVVEICYMLNVVCVCCLVYLSPVVEIRDVKCLCVLSRLSQPSSRDLLYVKCFVCVVSLSQPSSRDLLMLNVCVCCCLVVSAQ